MPPTTCCFTGHRYIPANKHDDIKRRLELYIKYYIGQDVTHFRTGGAQGFDTMAALAVLKLKYHYPQIRLILILPCKNQTKGWREKHKMQYDLILCRADEIVYTSEHYYEGCMHVRNRRLVDNSDICICYLEKSFGGTAYTVGYAKEKAIPVINVARHCCFN